MAEINIHNNSDIGVVCGSCGCSFTGKATYASELLTLLKGHGCPPPTPNVN